jgi:DNA-binding transcriptional regulator YiaG
MDSCQPSLEPSRRVVLQLVIEALDDVVEARLDALELAHQMSALDEELRCLGQQLLPWGFVRHMTLIREPATRVNYQATNYRATVDHDGRTLYPSGMTKTKRTMGLTIRNARRRAKLTQEDLAERCGVTKQSVSKWESGLALPSHNSLEMIALALKMSVGRLFGEAK